MKKRIVALILIIILSVGTVYASGRVFELTEVDYTVRFGGAELKKDNLPTLLYEGSTYIPLRKFSEASGMDVYFDGNTDSIDIWNNKLYEVGIYAGIAETYTQIYSQYECLLNCYLQLVDAYNNLLHNDSSEFFVAFAGASGFFNNLSVYKDSIADNIVYLQIAYEKNSNLLQDNPCTNLIEYQTWIESTSSVLEQIMDLMKGYVSGTYNYDYYFSNVNYLLYNVFQNNIANQPNPNAATMRLTFYIKLKEICGL